MALIVDFTCAGVQAGCLSRSRAARPATNGDAIDVPSFTSYALGVPAEAAAIDTPGATTSGLIRPSIVGPRLENGAR